MNTPTLGLGREVSIRIPNNYQTLHGMVKRVDGNIVGVALTDERVAGDLSPRLWYFRWSPRVSDWTRVYNRDDYGLEDRLMHRKWYVHGSKATLNY